LKNKAASISEAAVRLVVTRSLPTPSIAPLPLPVDLIPKGLQARVFGIDPMPHLQPRLRRGAIAFRQEQFDLRARKPGKFAEMPAPARHQPIEDGLPFGIALPHGIDLAE